MIGQVKVLEKEKPLGLFSQEFSRFLEVGEVLVVCKNLHREGGSKKILSPFFYAADNGQQLPIEDVVVVFCGHESFVSVHVVLHKHSS